MMGKKNPFYLYDAIVFKSDQQIEVTAEAADTHIYWSLSPGNGHWM